eukprot:superscaffoldBa00001596_g11239
MILYNRKKVKYRKDGYCWKKRKDGKTTREDHMKLKVQGVEVSGLYKSFRISRERMGKEAGVGVGMGRARANLHPDTDKHSFTSPSLHPTLSLSTT